MADYEDANGVHWNFSDAKRATIAKDSPRSYVGPFAPNTPGVVDTPDGPLLVITQPGMQKATVDKFARDHKDSLALKVTASADLASKKSDNGLLVLLAIIGVAYAASKKSRRGSRWL